MSNGHIYRNLVMFLLSPLSCWSVNRSESDLRSSERTFCFHRFPGIFLKILTSLAYKASHHSLLACLLSRRHFASRENLWLLSKSRPSKAILFRFLSWYLYFTMSTGIPYIGTRISLISKSEIRYEGILYTIDTKESTVTLANGTLCVWKLVPAFEQAFFLDILKFS